MGNIVQNVKAKLAADELVLCMSFGISRTIDSVMIAKACGFETIYVDMEHGALSIETTSLLCAAAVALDIVPMVRVPSNLPEHMSRVLDGGALGIVAPHVNSRAEAEAVVRACKFPPEGKRSILGPTPALKYKAMSFLEATVELNRELLTTVMLETPEAIERADEIAAVPGVDILLIGAQDLCAEMGIIGQVEHPRLRQAYQTVATACRKHGKTLGLGGIKKAPELQAELIRIGARFISAGSDYVYMMEGAKADVAAFRAISYR